MRRNDREKTKEEALDILAKGSYGILCTLGENGYPAGTPLNYVSDVGSIYVHFAKGNALESATKHPKVGFTVVTRSDVVPSEFVTNYESVMVYGRAVELHGQQKYDALYLLIKKYSPGFEESGIEHIKEDIDKCHVLKISIDHLTGKGRTG
ncbi:MAG: pyridoxamine 5'-phosphate oxidase family protein [Treponema sp.]|nr:pyridoxamine 5'-phosphate oxidase family protein [Treponema sp.]